MNFLLFYLRVKFSDRTQRLDQWRHYAVVNRRHSEFFKQLCSTIFLLKIFSLVEIKFFHLLRSNNLEWRMKVKIKRKVFCFLDDLKFCFLCYIFVLYHSAINLSQKNVLNKVVWFNLSRLGWCGNLEVERSSSWWSM